MPAQLLECITNVFTVFLLNAFVHIYICCIRYYIAIKYMHAYIFGIFAACLATSSTMPPPLCLSLSLSRTHTRRMPGQLLDYATSSLSLSLSHTHTHSQNAWPTPRLCHILFPWFRQ